MNDFKNILIIRTDRIGDVVCSTPAIKALRDHFPQAKISILVSSKTKDIVYGNPYLDEVIEEDRSKKHKGFWGTLKLILFLRRKKFDLAIVYHTKRRTNWMAFCAGIPRRLGYKNNKLGYLLTDPVKDERHLGKIHEAEYCLKLLEHIGVKQTSLDFFVSVNEQAQDWLKRFLINHRITPQERLIIIHPGASDPARCWPHEQFAELVERIAKSYPSRFVLIGDNKITSIWEKLIDRHSLSIINLLGQTRLAELISLMKRANLLVSNDSGPVHLASGLQTPVVAIFIRNQPGINPERWRPFGDFAKVVSVAPDLNISFKKAGEIKGQSVETITTQQVFDAVDAILKSC
jgi:lipopolysaccharide heptosyltransferase II